MGGASDSAVCLYFYHIFTHKQGRYTWTIYAQTREIHLDNSLAKCIILYVNMNSFVSRRNSFSKLGPQMVVTRLAFASTQARCDYPHKKILQKGLVKEKPRPPDPHAPLVAVTDGIFETKSVLSLKQKVCHL